MCLSWPAAGLPVRPRKAVGRQPGDPRAVVLHCHLLDAPPPSLAPEPRETPTRAAVRAKIERSLRAGIEFWQVGDPMWRGFRVCAPQALVMSSSKRTAQAGSAGHL